MEYNKEKESKEPITDEIIKRRTARFHAWLKFIVFFQLCILIPAHLLSEKILENISINLSQWEFTFILYMIGNIFFYAFMFSFLKDISKRKVKIPPPSTCMIFLGFVSVMALFVTFGKYIDADIDVLQMITDIDNETMLTICKDYMIHFFLLLHAIGLANIQTFESDIDFDKLDHHNNKKKTDTNPEEDMSVTDI